MFAILNEEIMGLSQTWALTPGGKPLYAGLRADMIG
jgi:hypothetical protein